VIFVYPYTTNYRSKEVPIIDGANKLTNLGEFRDHIKNMGTEQIEQLLKNILNIKYQTP
jgi:hypothetical protein